MPIRRADDTGYALLVNGAATGAAFDIKGGQYAFVVDGTFGGATASLEFQGSTAFTTVNANGVAVSLTANGTRTPIDLPAGRVRCAIAGGTPSAMYASLIGMG